MGHGALRDVYFFKEGKLGKGKISVFLSLVGVSLLLAVSCASPAQTTTTTPPTTTTRPPSGTTTAPPQTTASEKPQYGGTLRLALIQDVTVFDDVVGTGFGPVWTQRLTNDVIWQGDWTKGHAGGYGTDETDWRDWYDVFDHKGAMAATSWKWTLDAQNNQGTLVYQIRQGVHFSLNPDSEASRLVAGRQMTVDDVVFSMKQVTTDARAYIYKSYPELRGADIQKTGPWEVTIKVPFNAMITAVAKLGAYVNIVPQEVVKKYGDMGDWHNAAGTGPFILKDYVTGSVITLVKNDKYWATDPIGPGKGNQLPYIDGLKYLIIPDASTRLAALRTGKVDQFPSVTYDDAASVKSSAPAIKSIEGILGGDPWWIYMNSQKAPFNDVRVRRALSMATDLQTIKNTVNHGLGEILTWPVEYLPSYKDIYLGLDDPAMPATVKELYTYNPTKAKQLLADAGFPNGFKTTALISQVEVDYMSIIKDMWSKVGVQLDLNVQDIGTRTSLYRQGTYDITSQAGGRGPLSVFYHMVTMVGHSPAGGSGSNINDPVIDKASATMQAQYLVDPAAAKATFKDSMKYVLDQAYVISRPMYPLTNLWWPWVKNYTGEYSVGYIMYDSWAQWVWIDQALKQSMGH
jgi:peptide/nickel transport system substrate-binding protein